MPATYTPPDIDRKGSDPRFRDPDDGDHGGGRRPPTDKRTGGGGDPDNWNDRKRGRRSPRERLERFRLGLFFALSAVFMFFVAIVSVFFVSQGSGRFDANARYINEWLPIAIPPILWLNSAILVLSSLTMEIARRHMFKEVHVMDEWLGFGKPTSRRASPWVLTTIMLGVLFLVGQWVAWDQLAAQRIHMATSPSSHSFFLFTGIHGLHLFVGVGALIAAFIGLQVSRQIENRQIMVDLAAWYWHSMGLLWLGLFALLCFCQ
jgi:cytochrome c oxidase subunit 3